MRTLLSLLAMALAVYGQSTPVIGGNCKLGMQDVQIGGKQTQFFLKCEAASDSPEGDGVWVVKSRAASPAGTEQQQPQHRPSKKPANPNICEQDNGARESESCAVSAMCLQADQNNPVNYLQCDQTTMRWVKKSCQDTFIFNFEQQTCIVPRKTPGTIAPNTSPAFFNCSDCPLGTICEGGQCIPAHGSTLCADGSAPLGSCPCMGETECTAKGICCPRSSAACIRCSNAKPCPQPLLCSPDNCCESRKARSPIAKLANELPFISPADLFEVGVVQGPAPGFRVVSLPHPRKFSMDMQEAVTFVPFAVEKTTKRETTSFPIPPSSTTSSTVVSSTGAASLGGCLGQGDCKNDLDCPSSFLCDGSCCRLSTCPSNIPVRFACSTNYQCGSKEKCFFGGCCALFPKPEAINLAVEDIAIEKSNNPYEQEIPTTITPRSMHPTSMMPSFGPSDVCEVDPRVSNCSIAFPCPESSECMFGVCCRMNMAKCASGLLALSLPETCRANDDCPIASRCEYSRCCPLENAEVTRNDEPPPIVIPKSNLEPTSFLIKKEGKSRCLTTPRCSSISLCPARFTCSLEGKCCRLDVFCPDGTVPEDNCDENHLCPSSAHSCMKIANQRVCCVNPDELKKKKREDDTACPNGSEEVGPRFGDYCRYSLQCPRPYFCNSRGKCCKPFEDLLLGQTSGLVCTYSSCSNSNPCSSGTCNNGYCCSSGSSSPTVIETKLNSTSTIAPLTNANDTNSQLKDQDDWPIGPPGYGFPENISDLDSVLVPATGDGHVCAGGFDSPLKCSVGYECPPGLSCDRLIGYCCPLLLPLTDVNNPSRPKSRRPPREDKEEEKRKTKLTFSSRPCCSFASSGSSGCNGCSQQQPIVISTCPGGGYPVGSCSSGYCASGYSCVSGSCCPSYSQQPSISIITCPSGGSSVGSCVSGACSTGYTCVSGSCCPSTTTTNPFVCSDGTQAVGGCVNGQCGTGYTCTNGLCCVGTGTSTVRCLDGSAAVGACIPSCTGNGCGGVQVTYYCGSGYTCTTGNICCAINSCPNGGTVLGPTVNGLCPTGYTAQNGICCSATCPDGSAGQPTVNGVCPSTLTLTNGVCCTGTNTVFGVCGTNNVFAIGPCTTGVAGPCGQGLGNQPGYACDATLTQCCPAVNTADPTFQLGPGVSGMCPVGYAIVYGISTIVPDPGICIDLQTVPGLCAAANQIGPCAADSSCPTGYTCNLIAEICCLTGTASFRRIRPTIQLPQHAPSYGRSLSSFMPRESNARDQSCPDGSLAASGCMNGLCGVGLQCINGLCCPESKGPQLKSLCPNGELAVSGCFTDGSCGAGFECVKRKNLCCPPGGNEPNPIKAKMNDSPLEPTVEKNEVVKTN